MPLTTLEKQEKNSTAQDLTPMKPELDRQQLVSVESTPLAADLQELQPQRFCFRDRFSDAMLMGAEVETVAKYLDAHQGWFTRCAQPMQVRPIGKNGYDLTIGSYHSFGYSIEPKVGLELLPQDCGVYRIQTVAIPNYTPPGYDVHFNAEMRLVEAVVGDFPEDRLRQRQVTRVEWDLDLQVYIKFPKFIYKLPASLIQGTGDKFLKQIVAHVSRRLTHKVRQDFHGSLGLDIPKGK